MSPYICSAHVPVTPSLSVIIVPHYPPFFNCQMRDVVECYDWRLQCCPYCIVQYTVSQLSVYYYTATVIFRIIDSTFFSHFFAKSFPEVMENLRKNEKRNNNK